MRLDDFILDGEQKCQNNRLHNNCFTDYCIKLKKKKKTWIVFLEVVFVRTVKYTNNVIIIIILIILVIIILLCNSDGQGRPSSYQRGTLEIVLVTVGAVRSVQADLRSRPIGSAPEELQRSDEQMNNYYCMWHYCSENLLVECSCGHKYTAASYLLKTIIPDEHAHAELYILRVQIFRFELLSC